MPAANLEKLFHDTLRRRILVLALAGLVLSVAIFGALGVWAVEESIARTLQERLTLGRAIASHLDYVLPTVSRHSRRRRVPAISNTSRAQPPSSSRRATNSGRSIC